MKVSYNRLFNKLKENSVTQKQFRETVGIGGTTMAKLKNNESITIDTICSICDYFRCMPDEIMEFIPEENYPEDIKAKQQAPDVQQIDTFYKRNILEAHEQLKMSEKEYQGQKPVIKIFLLYESMTNTQIVMSSIPEIFVDDSRCYIMTIEDLEMMLATYKNGKEKFEKVVKALVTNQNSNAQVTSVLHVLNDCDAVGDMHFIEDRDYFMKIAKRMEKELEV